MLGRMEHVDLARLVAPRPLLVETGAEDLLFPVAAAERARGAARPVYERFGAGDRWPTTSSTASTSGTGAGLPVPRPLAGLAPERRDGPGRLGRRVGVSRRSASSAADWGSRKMVAWGGPLQDRGRAGGADRPSGRPAPGRPCGPRARWRGPVPARSSAGMVTVIAWAGTSASVAKCPSSTCWRRQAASSSTTFTSSGSSKSATGGSLKARWPFSPIPRQHRSSGWSAQQLGVAAALVVRAGRARRGSGRPGVGPARRSARGSSAGSRPDGRARRPRTRPCGRRRRRAQGTSGSAHEGVDEGELGVAGGEHGVGHAAGRPPPSGGPGGLVGGGGGHGRRVGDTAPRGTSGRCPWGTRRDHCSADSCVDRPVSNCRRPRPGALRCRSGQPMDRCAPDSRWTQPCGPGTRTADRGDRTRRQGRSPRWQTTS